MAADHPPVMILCGGRGTRLQARGASVPKPLIEIGGRPIVWHVIRIYAAHGFRRFVLLTGYRSADVEAFAAAEPWPGGVAVSCVDGGEDTPTGARIARARGHVPAGTVAVTYADGVADVDLGAQLAWHRGHDGAATICLVRPRLPFGIATVDGDDHVTGFAEKPRSQEWINGGFMLFEQAALDRIGPADVLERAPLDRLAADGQLRGWRHTGFWECLDTHKDALALNDLWAAGPPWRIWEESPPGGRNTDA